MACAGGARTTRGAGPRRRVLGNQVTKGKKSQANKSDQLQTVQESRLRWIPLWGWILIFLVPLLVSEYMFYRVGRTWSMVLFPIAWVGFWVTRMYRSGWAILRKRQKK
jgi:hypothetical protein